MTTRPLKAVRLTLQPPLLEFSPRESFLAFRSVDLRVMVVFVSEVDDEDEDER